MRLVLLLTLLPLAACAGAGTGMTSASDAGLTHQQRVQRDMQAILEGMQNANGVAESFRTAPLSGESVTPPLRRMPGFSPY